MELEYKTPKSYAELIETLKQLKNVEEQLEYILLFFKNDVKYNYRYLTAAYRTIDKDGVLFEKGSLVEAISLYAKEIDNETTNSQTGEYVFPSKEQREKNVYRILEKLKTNFPFLKNLSKAWVKQVLELYGTTKLLNSEGNSASNKITYHLLASVGTAKIDRYRMNGDLLTEGVCADFARLIGKICKDIGLECKYVRGSTGSVGHAWNIINVNGKELHFDVTYSMFVRDNYNNWQNKAKWEDFVGVSFDRIKQLNPKRKIISIDGEPYIKTNSATTFIVKK